MQKVFFVSDTHFNHIGLLKLRPQFKSLEEMNETIVENWNRVVRRGDRVYHLGDVALGRPEDAVPILERLNGEIYLVRGNHDTVAKHRLCREFFIWIKDYDFLTVGEQGIVLCHYALKTWDKMHYNTWQLHGHSHGSLKPDGSLQHDVGVDCNKFSPIEFEAIREIMASKRFRAVDHHVPRAAMKYPWEKTDENPL